MIIKKYFLLSFLAFSTFIFAQPSLESLLESYLGYKKLRFDINIQFQITENKEISAEVSYIDNRYLIFTFKNHLYLKIFIIVTIFSSQFFTQMFMRK